MTQKMRHLQDINNKINRNLNWNVNKTPNKCLSKKIHVRLIFFSSKIPKFQNRYKNYLPKMYTILLGFFSFFFRENI